jgi:hypothetical protein
MTHAISEIPLPAADPPLGAPAFAPVPVRHRHDGWTPAKQTAFIEALADTACVVEAARRVGMSAESAYRLRRHAGATAFIEAWDSALDHAVQRLVDTAFARAIHGVPRAVFHKGEQVGEQRIYSDRLLTFLLRYHDPNYYGNLARITQHAFPRFLHVRRNKLRRWLGRITGSSAED